MMTFSYAAHGNSFQSLRWSPLDGLLAQLSSEVVSRKTSG